MTEAQKEMLLIEAQREILPSEAWTEILLDITGFKIAITLQPLFFLFLQPICTQFGAYFATEHTNLHHTPP